MPRLSDSALERIDVSVLAELRAGLTAVRKRLPARYFIDRRGFELLERMAALPECYQPRAEAGILADWLPALIAARGPRAVVELAAGIGARARPILDAMEAAGTADTYVPVDSGGVLLREAAIHLRSRYPRLRVVPVVADIAAGFELARPLPRPTLFAVLEAKIAGLHESAAVRLLRQVHLRLGPGDALLLGLDLRHDPRGIEASYNDRQGLAAEFNRNTLLVLNRRLGADFDPEGFEHRAVYRASTHRVEIQLVARRDQRVTVPGVGIVVLTEGESLRTAVHAKYDRESAGVLLADAGLRLDEWRTDPCGRYAVALSAPARPEPRRGTALGSPPGSG